jgi:hypothetical protein
MGMGSPENRRKADGSYRAQGVGGSISFPASPIEANNGWTSDPLDDCDLACRRDVDRWPNRALLRIF